MSDEPNLVDDLADVLVRMVLGWEDKLGVDLAQHPDVVRVMARFREEREAYANQRRWGLEVAADCALWGNCVHQRTIEGEIRRVDPATYKLIVDTRY